MQLWQNLLWVGGGLLAVLLVSLMPSRAARWVARLGVNAILGLALLTVINLLSGFTQLFLPLNTLTVAVSSLLGAPGILALTVLALV